MVYNFTCSTTKFVVLNFVLSRERRTVLADELVRRECVAGVAMTTTRADKFPNSCKARRVAWHLFYIPKLLGRVSAALVFKERLPLFPYSYYILDSWPALACSKTHTKASSSRCGMFRECFEWFDSPAAQHTYPHLSTRTREVETLRQPLENVWWDYHAQQSLLACSVSAPFSPIIHTGNQQFKYAHQFAYFPSKFFY